MNEAVGHYVDNFNAIGPRLAHDGPEWVMALRRDALARFRRTGFPGERDETWKYTSTRPLERRKFVFTQSVPECIDSGVIEPVMLRATPAFTLVFVNGQHLPSAGSAPSAVAGLRVTSLRTMLTDIADPLQPYLTRGSIAVDDPFTDLNMAFLQDGVLIELDDRLRLEPTLQLIFVSTEQAHPSVCHPRILVKLGAHARATVLETYYGLKNAANLTNGYAQIYLGEHAQLEHLRLQRESANDFHVSRVQVTQQQGSRYISHTLNLGGLWVRTDLSTRLEAPESGVIFNGLYQTTAGQHVDNHTRIDHLSPRTHSEELYRGIVGGHSRAVFNGKVVVARDAVAIDATQINNNLLLSRHAEIDTKPELEIYADDVQCSHGATIGQLDEQALFYLQSRGIDPQTARGMLIDAFSGVVLTRFAMPALREFAHRQLTAAS